MKSFWGVRFVALMTGVEWLVIDDILHRSVSWIFYIASLNATTVNDSDHVYFARFPSSFVGVYEGYLLNVELPFFCTCLCFFRDAVKAGLWTMDWTVDWNAD